MSEEVKKPVKRRSNKGTSFLTPRARKLCNLIVSGTPNSNAYRIAYRQPKLLSDDASERAWVIMNRPAAKAYINQLRGESKRKTLLTLNDRLEILAEIAQDGSANKSDRTRAIDVYSKISGDHAPERHEHTVSAPGGGPIEQVIVTRAMSPREKLQHMKAARESARRAEEESKL